MLDVQHCEKNNKQQIVIQNGFRCTYADRHKLTVNDPELVCAVTNLMARSSPHQDGIPLAQK